MANSDTQSIAILGAGITGLTAAHRLSQRGHRVRVFEQSGRVGGAIRTESTGGWLVEAGPNSLLTGEPAVDEDPESEPGSELTLALAHGAPGAEAGVVLARQGRPLGAGLPGHEPVPATVADVEPRRIVGIHERGQDDPATRELE